MPRTSPWLFRRAQRYSPHVASLLLACRDLPSALNEFRWIQDHVHKAYRTQKPLHLTQLCQRRSRGVPLQYILGSQPFGPLDIKCKPGVLIPRPETESYTYYLAHLIRTTNSSGLGWQNGITKLSILDLCTGTGCIPLLLFSLLQRHIKRLECHGVDVLEKAIQLARENFAHNLDMGNIATLDDDQRISFSQGDIFLDDQMKSILSKPLDVLISNPPYISRRVWNAGRGQLGHSVRKFEPESALVPRNDANIPCGWEHEDVFYARLLDIAMLTRPAFTLLEVADQEQAQRILSKYFAHDISKDSRVEVWRDYVDVNLRREPGIFIKHQLEGGGTCSVLVKGEGIVRAIFIQR